MMTAQKKLKVSRMEWAETLSHIWGTMLNLFWSVLAAMVFFTIPVHAQGPATVADEIQHMTYEVYAGGIHAVQAKLDIDYPQEDRYKVALSAYTQGFLGSLVPWKGSFETSGWRNKNGERPELHRSVATWRGEKEVKDYSYSKDGHFNSLKIVEGGIDKSPKSVKDELTQGTTDALTAVLQVMETVGAGRKCEGSSEVFDGKRRYEMVFRHEKNEELSSTRYNIYEGTAARCVIEIKPIAGAWHKKPRGWLSIQEQGREKGSLPTIWMASMSEGAPAVPIKLRMKTSYGTLFMHLVGYSDGTKTISIDD